MNSYFTKCQQVTSSITKSEYEDLTKIMKQKCYKNLSKFLREQVIKPYIKKELKDGEKEPVYILSVRQEQ